jgi:hypothetical protein
MKTYKIWIAIIILMALLALLQMGCQEGAMGLRFSPTEAMRQNSEMTHALAKEVHSDGADAGSAATEQLVAGTEVNLSYTGRPKTPVDASQFSTVNTQAREDAVERPNVGEATDAALNIGLGIAALLGGGAGVKLAGNLRRVHGKAKAFQEVVSENEIFKRMASPEMQKAFKTAHKDQSAATRVLVAEAKATIL